MRQRMNVVRLAIMALFTGSVSLLLTRLIPTSLLVNERCFDHVHHHYARPEEPLLRWELSVPQNHENAHRYNEKVYHDQVERPILGIEQSKISSDEAEMKNESKLNQEKDHKYEIRKTSSLLHDINYQQRIDPYHENSHHEEPPHLDNHENLHHEEEPHPDNLKNPHHENRLHRDNHENLHHDEEPHPDNLKNPHHEEPSHRDNHENLHHEEEHHPDNHKNPHHENRPHRDNHENLHHEEEPHPDNHKNPHHENRPHSDNHENLHHEEEPHPDNRENPHHEEHPHLDYPYRKELSSLPQPVLIVSTWRSGSSFFGAAVAMPRKDSFYSYEPLQPWLLQQRETGNKSNHTVYQLLEDFFHCSFQKYPKVINKLTQTLWRDWNKRLMRTCNPIRKCKDMTFVSRVCQNSSLHVVKVVRLTLSTALHLLEDPRNSRLQVIHLVRDPRAVMSSRLRMDWCVSKECRTPIMLCKHHMRDLKLVPELLHRYPERYTFVRYEDVILNPVKTMTSIWKFLNLSVGPDVIRALKKETKTSHKTPNGYKENFSWRSKLSYESVKSIQHYCHEVIEMLGLKIISSRDEYKNLSLPTVVSSKPPLFLPVEQD